VPRIPRTSVGINQDGTGRLKFTRITAIKTQLIVVAVDNKSSGDNSADTTSMPVLVTLGRKCTLAALRAATW